MSLAFCVVVPALRPGRYTANYDGGRDMLAAGRFRPRTSCRGCAAARMTAGGRRVERPVADGADADRMENGFLPADGARMEGRPPGRDSEFQDSRGETVGTLSRETEKSFDTVLQELVAIQQDGPRNVAILGTRYTSYLHQQIIELLTYANVLVGNHVFTSGAGGTNAAVIRGALRAERPKFLTVVLPQSLHKQPAETQEQVR